MTDAARYSVLHNVARELLDQLSRDYAVEVIIGPTVDEDLAGRAPTETTVRLQPSSGEGAPLTFAFTQFPGLIVRFGTWQVETYPLCGCDACDEQPADLTKRLRGQVGVIVSDGFTERAGRRRLGRDEVRMWSPWTPRPSM